MEGRRVQAADRAEDGEKGGGAQGGLVSRHVGERSWALASHQRRATSCEVAGAAMPASPAVPGSQVPLGPRPRLDVWDWSCRGRRAYNPACAGVAVAAGALPQVLGCRDGREHRARGARTPGRRTPARARRTRGRRRRGRSRPRAGSGLSG